MKSLKKFLAMLLLVCMAVSTLAGMDADDILSADLPVAYGDAQFRQRVLERTKGERSPVGLVLSGGSARAFAHIGVLKYLEEQDIVVDFIISNSMGSIVGLMYAAGLSPDQILESITGVSIQSLFDTTLPLQGGFLDSARFLAKVASILGPDLKLETLPIPIIVINEDLVTKRQIHISEGDYYTILRGSFALPVYFPPVEFRGHLLLDGGVTNIVPVDLAYEYADSVIVSTTFYDVDTLNLKNPLTVLNVSLDIGKRRRGVEELKRSLDDVIWIRNDVEDVSFMEFSKVDYLAQKGYESALLQEQALSGVYKSGISADLSQLRLQLQKTIQNGKAQYDLFNHVPVNVPSHLLGTGLDSDYSNFDTSALKDDTTLGLKYVWKSDNLSLSANAGYAFNFVTNDHFAAVPAVRTQVDYHLLKHLKATGYASLLFDVAKKAPILSFGAVLEGRLFALRNTLRLGLMQSFEQMSNFLNSSYPEYWNGTTYLYTIRLEGVLADQKKQGWSFADTSVALNYQILGDYSANRSFLTARVESELEQNSWDMFTSVESFARFALDGNGDVPFFTSDGFRTTNTLIKAQGHDLSLSANPANHLVGINLAIGYRPSSFRPTMAELFIFQNSSVAVYTDLLWHQKSFKPSLSLGLEVQTDISLIGIRTLPVTVYGGWDQSVNTFVWGFFFNVIF
ncbi:patatin-like phospholipase family protein [Sphaerochaeta sp.]|uniref:patatin-like phospholipase family protein n=1 Tax=Sphaerochaeta sp. TaxID=1972642 RepID=UPI0025882690|nr:patatin-like phospholipase family protein [Sphaerochaeta sp.]MDD3425149.1 patatin-like phospholipase family protein [Sphaerochaeta sp.]